MDLLLFRPVDFERLYNCTGYQVDSIPLGQRQRPILGSIALAMFFVFEACYLPCMVAIWRRIEQSCCKLMFVIGLVDIPCLFIIALLTGLLAIQGAVFCSYPMTIFICGMFGDFCWSMETATAVILAFNRCLELALPAWAELLFKGNRTWLWVAPVLVWSFYYGFFSLPITWSSISFSWFFDPHIGYLEDIDNLYHNQLDVGHDYAVAIAIPSLYTIFLVIFMWKRSQIGNNARNSASSKMVFTQVFLLSLLNTFVATLYISMDFLPVNPVIVAFNNYMWILTHGLAPIIYLTINKSLRKECRSIISANAHKLIPCMTCSNNSNNNVVQVNVITSSRRQ